MQVQYTVSKGQAGSIVEPKQYSIAIKPSRRHSKITFLAPLQSMIE